jgi:hypothetical protein
MGPGRLGWRCLQKPKARLGKFPIGRTPFHFGNHCSPRVGYKQKLASIEASMFVSRAQPMQAGIYELPTNVNEAFGPHYGENDFAVGHESRLAAALNVELGNPAV